MKSQLFIPNKIKVGFNLRHDTYTGKLGYVIYHDGKVWRKEDSWKKWIQKPGQKVGTYENGKWVQKTIGDELNPLEFDNVPTEGFVLNKKAGGYSSGWNHRATYCRVYDPRGFEFEISIPNLLFILQETSSFKGKGLDGEFVYSWEGKDLVLLPATCEDYKKSSSFTKLQSEKVGVKDMAPGCTYKTKKEESLIYLGKFNWYSMGYTKGRKYYDKEMNMNKYHIFVDERGNYVTASGLTNIASKTSDTPVSNYAELMETFSKTQQASKPVEIIDEAVELKFQDKKDAACESYWLENGEVYVKQADNLFQSYTILVEYSHDYSYLTRDYKRKFSHYKLQKNKLVSFVDGKLTMKSNYDYSYGSRENNEVIVKTKEDLCKMNFRKLSLKLENNKSFAIKNF